MGTGREASIAIRAPVHAYPSDPEVVSRKELSSCVLDSVTMSGRIGLQ